MSFSPMESKYGKKGTQQMVLGQIQPLSKNLGEVEVNLVKYHGDLESMNIIINPIPHSLAFSNT